MKKEKHITDNVDLSFNNALDKNASKISVKTNHFTKQIQLKVSPDTYMQWKEAKKRIEEICGYDNESKVFEFLVVEFLNIPIESYE